MKLSHQSVPKARRGIAAVEAAAVFPIILLFLAGSVDLGRLAKVSDSLTTAARNGAQYGSANTTAASDSAGIRAAAMTEMANLPNVSASNPTITNQIITNSSTGAQYLQVTVSYNLTGTSFFNIWPVNTMTRTVEMPMMPQ